MVLLEEAESDFKDATCFCNVRWLSSAKTLHRFYSLLSKISIFTRSKEHEHDELTDKSWILDLAFLADIREHILIVKLQL